MVDMVWYDRCRFAYGDVGGRKIHESRPREYAGVSFGPGDVIGCYIYLPSVAEATSLAAAEAAAQPSNHDDPLLPPIVKSTIAYVPIGLPLKGIAPFILHQTDVAIHWLTLLLVG
jgi:hypothetical protein